MKTLLLTLLLVPMMSFGQIYKELVDKIGNSISGVIGWSDNGEFFAFRNIVLNDIWYTDEIGIISLVDNKLIEAIYLDPEFGTWNQHKKEVDSFLLKYNIIQHDYQNNGLLKLDKDFDNLICFKLLKLKLNYFNSCISEVKSDDSYSETEILNNLLKEDSFFQSFSDFVSDYQSSIWKFKITDFYINYAFKNKIVFQVAAIRIPGDCGTSQDCYESIYNYYSCQL